MADDLVIDVDGHVFEPDELWAEYLPARFHERRPRLVHDDRGTTRYLLEGHLIPPGSGPGAWVPEGIREASAQRDGAVDPHARLADMDLEGIDIAVLYGAASLGFYALQDPDLAMACCRAYNDWLHDYCAADPARLKGTPALPLGSMDAACVEARRAVTELGFVSLTLPCALGTRNLDDPVFDPIYTVAEELDVPLGFHAGGARLAHHRFVDSYAQLHAFEFPANIMLAVTTLVCGGVLQRHPRLRAAMLEAGVGWAPYYFERLDEHYEHRAHEMPAIDRPPSAFLDDGRLVISTEGEDGLAHAMHELGAQAVVWASDYPHWDSEFPGSVRKVSDRDDLTDAERRALFDANPRRLYGW
jgi:predicted TIM-barrel fold metal-dependent hydrolase